jgi:mono/diheme cytochrome c family protein
MIQSNQRFRFNSSAHRNSLLALAAALAVGSPSVGWAAPDDVRRGDEVFKSHCARCHQPQELTNRLRSNWPNRNAGELFERIKTTMPAESPGSRSDA